MTVGEPLPTDDRSVRLHRTGTLAGRLVDQGHTVVWWTSTFDHFRRRQRFDCDTRLKLDDRFSIHLLHAGGYRANVSLARLYDHAVVGVKFCIQAQREPPPDVVLASLPTLELSYGACRFGRHAKVPVALDIRDLWPDVFLDAFPSRLKRVGRLLLAPYVSLAQRACRAATAILGSTEEYVNWGVTLAGRQKSPLDRDFPFGYCATPPTPTEINAAEEFWRTWGISEDRNQFIVCFFGTLGRQFDLDTVIEAAKTLAVRSPRIKLVICGTGGRQEYYRVQAGSCSNVIFPGWVNRPEIWALMRMSALGVAPYKATENFLRNVPNKPIEYLSAGLPVLYCLGGALDGLLSGGGCGVRYAYGDAGDLADQVSMIEQNPGLLCQLANKATALYRARFQAETVYSGMVEHLELIARSASRAG